MKDNTIPPITSEMGRSWQQPKTDRILIDDTHAIMRKREFDDLAEYSTTKPSGVYPGKMWKGEYFDPVTHRPTGRWYLSWFGIVPDNDKVCSNNHREILLVGA